jgi:endoglucanase
MLGAVTMGTLAAVGTLAAGPPPAYVRVDQAGYPATAAKRAYVLSPVKAVGATFTVRDASGATVLTGPVGPRTGRWSRRFPDVRRIDLDGLTAPGTYTVAVGGPVAGASPPFTVAPARDLYAPLIADSSTFFAAQRDGADVDRSVLDRRPSHLNDRRAPVYARGLRHLRRLRGTHDVSGGWFDAGDYLKFVETHSYATVMLLLAHQDATARPGIEWLLRMWDDRTRTLYYQVGIGDGDGCVHLCGDHDVWRLPQADDHYPGGAKFRFIRHRPVFRAGPPRSRISPNLAGRLTAAFALCARTYPDLARRCRRSARHVYALADRHPHGLLSVSPHDFYPEDSWRDDMELGAAELGRRRDAARFSRGAASGDTLNLYDVSALAHYELARRLPAGSALRRRLTRAIRRQLTDAQARAAKDPFGSGFAWDQYDVTSHLMGLATTASLYRALTGSHAFDAFADRQLGAAFGANPWGVSFVVGAGTTFPHCMQHQVANLSGSLDGSAPLVLGAAVNGSNDRSQFEDSSSTPGGARRCPAAGGDAFARFTGANGARFQDNVGAWMSVEPAIDFTAGVPLALGDVIDSEENP